MIDKFTCKVRLKQITPLVIDKDLKNADEIFIKDTEVKSWLNKFLYAICSENEVKKFTLGGSNETTKGFNCKVRNFKYINRNNEKLKLRQATIWDDTTKMLAAPVIYRLLKHGCFLEFEIFSIHMELIQKLKENVYQLFNIQNLGRRKNKTFGQFEVVSPLPDSKVRVSVLDQFINIYHKVSGIGIKSIYSVELSGFSDSNFNGKIKFINKTLEVNYFKDLKSGTNFRDDYVKSWIMRYYNDKFGTRWEKKMIKVALAKTKEYSKETITYDSPFEGFFFKRLKITKEHNNDKHKDRKSFYKIVNERLEGVYARCLLGMAENFEFKLHNGYIDNKRYDKIQVKVHSVNNEIKQYPSPLLYKIIGNKLYIIALEKDPIFNRKVPFYLTATMKGKIKDKNGKWKNLPEVILHWGQKQDDPEKLFIHTPDNFDINEFLSYKLSRDYNDPESEILPIYEHMGWELEWINDASNPKTEAQ